MGWIIASVPFWLLGLLFLGGCAVRHSAARVPRNDGRPHRSSYRKPDRLRHRPHSGCKAYFMTPQQIANDLLAEHQANRKRNMTLLDYDVNVKPHLEFITSGAEMAARHARALPCRPGFPTVAEGELAAARATLEAALQNIIAAQETYQSKQTEAAA